MLAFIVFSSIVLQLTCADEGPLVDIPQGTVKGSSFLSRDGVAYSGFYDIPYAKFQGRFEPSDATKAPGWEGIRDGSKPEINCAQRNVLRNITVGTEDCLVLNVFTRKADIKANYPVMVYIHGGGFNWGMGHIHGAKYFMDEKVVLVTINYRLGVFGFLSTGDEVIQGNLGLKDQIAALQWVQLNIGFFGGDPRSVTVFGESAGGAAVSLLILSPMSKGLFHRAISQSGAALCPWSCWKNPKINALELAEAFHCDTSTSQSIADCIKTKPMDAILSHNWAKWANDPTAAIGPVVEKLRPGQSDSDVFLSKTPFELLMTGKYNKVPWIAGVNKEEGEYLHATPILANPAWVRDMNERFEEIAPITLAYYEDEMATEEELATIGSKIKRFYFQDKPISEATRQALTDMYSDRYFVHGVYKTAVMQAKYSPVYLYLFNFTGSFSFMKERGYENVLGVTHKDDLQYLFNGISINPDPRPGEELQVSRYMIKNWVHFAKTGKPLDPTWDQVSLRQTLGSFPLGWFKIDEKPGSIPDPFKRRNQFWDEMITKHAPLSYPLPKPPQMKVVVRPKDEL